MFWEGQVMDESKIAIFFWGEVLMERFERMGMVGIQMVPLPSEAGVLYVFCAPLYWGLLSHFLNFLIPCKF